MDRAELMRMQPEYAVSFISWESIEWLFEPRTAFQLLLRLNYEGTIKILRQKLDIINKLEEGKEMELWGLTKKDIAVEDYFRMLKDIKSKQEKRMNKKFQIVMKDPDGVYDSMYDAGYDLDDLPSEIEDVVNKFFTFKEIVTIELDIETGKATLVPR